MAAAMPRLLLVMVLTLLVAAPAAMAGTRGDIIADCYDDGKLDGNYSPSEIRDARNNLPADVDQYSRLPRRARARARRHRRQGGRRRRRRRARSAAAAAASGPAEPLTPERPARSRRRSTRPRSAAATQPIQVGDGTIVPGARARHGAARNAIPPACSPS